MDDQVTLLRPEAPSKDARPGSLSSLPPDLLEQIRGRVRLLALFLTIGFAIDPVLYFAGYGAAALAEVPLRPDFYKRLPFQWANLGAMAASATVWAVTRHRQILPSRLLTLGLIYEVVICFVIAVGTIWEYYVVKGFLPSMTWVPVVVILFPVILPGPPRRMLIAAALAAGMVPLSLWLLQRWNAVPVTADDYVDGIIQGGFSVALAYIGARVVYGLGREVAKARELGSYRLEERLGAGGMGEVWRARHRMLARPAAIKLIRPALAGDTRAGVSREAIDRFEREAQAIARLRSPHTVELFDFGIATDGAFYYAMELLDGIDADTLVRKFGPVPAERAVFLLRQVCHSLSEADACCLVHRDIKPANIFLCRYGEDCDFVKVLDFGLVKGSAGWSRHPSGAHPGEHGVWHTRIHGARAGPRPGRSRWSGGCLCHRLCRLLAPDGATGLHRGEPHGAHGAARQRDAGPSIHPHRAADPYFDRRPGAFMSGKRPLSTTAIGEGADGSARRRRRREQLDRKAGAGVVGAAPPGAGGVTATFLYSVSRRPDPGLRPADRQP
jgi:serine/threonine-protein kinase